MVIGSAFGFLYVISYRNFKNYLEKLKYLFSRKKLKNVDFFFLISLSFVSGSGPVVISGWLYLFEMNVSPLSIFRDWIGWADDDAGFTIVGAKKISGVVVEAIAEIIRPLSKSELWPIIPV